MQTRKILTLGAAVGISVGSWGCATKKHVREAIAPVQGQVDQVQKQTGENKTAIGDLDRQVATADEKATDAGKRAGQAAEAATRANSAATAAQQRADAANSAAQQAQEGVSRLDRSLQNLDNYRLVNTQQVYFRTGRTLLDKQAQADLDAAIQNVMSMHNYIIEVEGFADRTGNKNMNVELSRKRADNVVRYLTVNHNIPLRDVRELGVGSEFPDAVNKTRDDRKKNRRVDVKIYALDVTGTGGSQATSSSNPTGDGASVNQSMPRQTQSMPRQTQSMPTQTGQSDRSTNNSQMPRQTPRTTP
ncbi:MAG: OmpA family protein [Acidobacteriota bacterium]|nr:OmpA family protein [Acidobacteriota bacterium]